MEDFDIWGLTERGEQRREVKRGRANPKGRRRQPEKSLLDGGREVVTLEAGGGRELGHQEAGDGWAKNPEQGNAYQ